MAKCRGGITGRLIALALGMVLAVGLVPAPAFAFSADGFGRPATGAAAATDGAKAGERAPEGLSTLAVGATVNGMEAQGALLANSDSGTIVSGLGGTTVRIRPQGSYSALAIKSDGSGYHSVVHMYHIGGSSRFHLEKAGSDSDGDWYKIKPYLSFTATDTSSRVFDIDGPSTDEGKVIHLTGDADKDNKKWRFIQQDDGSYYIKSKYSGKYWSLKDSDKNEDSNKLCQSATPMKWEVEIVSTDGDAVMDDGIKQYDSYNIDNDGNTGSGTAITGCNWMNYLPDSVHLTSLSIPGAHDACTCNISISGFSSLYRGQQFYFDKLLNIGVRYFDLRIVKKNDELKLRHGSDTTGCMCKDSNGNEMTLDEVVNWTESFFGKYPNETVIYQLKDESSSGTASDDIYSYFKNLATEDASIIYCGDGAPTLGEARGKIVLITRCNTGSDYYIDDNDHSKGKWAIAADWQEGSNYETAQAASTDEYEVWTQDNYNMNASSKWTWVKYALFGQDGYTGAKDRRNEVESRTDDDGNPLHKKEASPGCVGR